MVCSCSLFLKNDSLTDMWLNSKYIAGSLDAPYKMVPLNSFILQFYIITSSSFISENEKHYIEKHLIANFTRFTLIYKHNLLSTIKSN